MAIVSRRDDRSASRCWRRRSARAAADLAASGLEPPAIVVLGAVVRLRAALDWLGALAGRARSSPIRSARRDSRTAAGRHDGMPRGFIVAAARRAIPARRRVTLGLIAALARARARRRRGEVRAGLHRSALPGGGERHARDQPRSVGDGARDRLRARLARQAEGADVVIVEGVMGLYDGGAGGVGLDRLARRADRPAGRARRRRRRAWRSRPPRSPKALRGWRTGSPSPARSSTRSPPTGTPTSSARALPAPPCRSSASSAATRRSRIASRHLGLVQAEEHADLAAKIARAGDARRRRLRPRRNPAISPRALLPLA